MSFGMSTQPVNPFAGMPPLSGGPVTTQQMPVSMLQAPSSPGGGLLNTASNYGFPLTQGLLSSFGPGGTALPPQTGFPDYSQIALQMAGNPHAGPYAPVPVPSGTGISGPGSSGGSTASSIGGLLSAVATNPSLAKSLTGNISSAGNAIKGLLGSSTPADVTEMQNAIANGTAATSANAGVGAGYGMLGDGTVDTSTFATPSMLSELGGDAGAASAAAPAAADTSTAFAPTGGLAGYATGAAPFSSAAGAGADAAATDAAATDAAAGSDAAASAGLGAVADVALPLAGFAGIYALGQADPFNTHDAFANANQALSSGQSQLKAALAANGGQVPVYGSPQYYNYISALNQISSEKLNLQSMQNGDFSAFSSGGQRPRPPYKVQNS